MLFQILLNRFKSVVVLSKANVAGLVFITVLLSSMGFYLTESASQEGLSYLDSLWWSIVTMTTVGYGDLSPQTNAGKFLVGVPTMLVGIAVLAILLDKVQTNITSRSRKERGLGIMKEDNHILIMGFPGEPMLVEIIREIKLDRLLSSKPICLVTDLIQEIPQSLMDGKVRFIKAKPSSPEALKRCNAENAHTIVILSDDNDNSESDGITLMRILNVRRYLDNKKIEIIAQCQDQNNEVTMITAGATEVITLEALTAGLVVQGIASQGINPILRDLLSNQVGFQIYTDSIPTSLQDRTFGEVCKKIEDSWKDVRPLGVLDSHRMLKVNDNFPLKEGSQFLYISEHRKRLESLG